jgi:hypothetical protein
MLGRKTYTRQELDNGKVAVAKDLAAYASLASAIAGGAADKKVASALERFETRYSNNMVLVLDRLFVHRLRVVTGKDANPLNEVEMVADSVMNNGGVLRANNVIKWIPEQTVLKLRIGDEIRLGAADFGRLWTAFFADLERKFLL